MTIKTDLQQRLIEALQDICWDAAALTIALKCHKATPWRWISGRAEPPEEIVSWVEDLAHYHRVLGPPPTWRRAWQHLDNKTEGLPTTVDRGSHDEASPALGSAPVHPALSDPIGGGGVAQGEHPDLGQRGEERAVAAG